MCILLVHIYNVGWCTVYHTSNWHTCTYSLFHKVGTDVFYTVWKDLITLQRSGKKKWWQEGKEGTHNKVLLENVIHERNLNRLLSEYKPGTTPFSQLLDIIQFYWRRGITAQIHVKTSTPKYITNYTDKDKHRSGLIVEAFDYMLTLLLYEIIQFKAQ